MQKLIFFGLLVFAYPAFASSDDPPDDLSQHSWSHRVLLLAAAQSDEPALLKMSEWLSENVDGVRERDLVVYRLKPDDLLAKRWQMSGAFTLLLIGKDGTEKLRTSHAVDLSVVFDTIDAMPMRRREMRGAVTTGSVSHPRQESSHAPQVRRGE